MNTPFPKLLRRTAFVLGLMGALFQAEDSFAQRKKMKLLPRLLLQHREDLVLQALQVLLPMAQNPTKKSLLPRQKPR